VIESQNKSAFFRFIPFWASALFYCRPSRPPHRPATYPVPRGPNFIEHLHPYLPHLLEDIAAGHQSQRETDVAAGVQNPTLEDVVGELERMRKEPGHTLGYYSGLSAGNFPPPEQLKNKEMLEVCKAFRKMMLSWNVKVSLPKGLPVRRVYTLLIRALERRIDPESCFSVVFGYCTLDCVACPLEKYCTCLKREQAEGGVKR
jgi:hypothetical protein